MRPGSSASLPAVRARGGGYHFRHLANHTTYHRGYIGDMLYQVPAKPPTTDLVFLRGVRLRLD